VELSLRHAVRLPAWKVQLALFVGFILIVAAVVFWATHT
jgi:hypothetical protein